MKNDERKTVAFRLGCVGLFLLFYVAPGLLGSIAGAEIPLILFYVIIGFLFILYFGVSPAQQKTFAMRRLKYFALMGTLLSFTAILLWIGSGKAGGEFTYEIGFGMGTNATEGGVSLERPLDPKIGQPLFGGMGILIGTLTLWFGIPYGKRLLKENAANDKLDTPREPDHPSTDIG